MTTAHALAAQTVLWFYTVVGVWGLWLGFRRSPMDGSYVGALVLAQITSFIPVVTGLALLATGGRSFNEVHYLYGMSLIVTLPLVHQFLAGRGMSAPTAFGLGCLFMAGLAVRGMDTARLT